jgi:ATP-dependent Clp protease ATP-binding subunit ClpB
MKALLEQPNGLARRVLAKAGANPTDLLDKTDAYIRQQPRISGDSQQVRTCTGFLLAPLIHS